MRNKLTLATLCTLVSGCGVSPGNPGVLVATTPAGASCMLTRGGQPIASVAPTPGIAVVEPAAGEITVRCSRHGFTDAAATLPAREEGPGIRIDIALQPRSAGMPR